MLFSPIHWTDQNASSARVDTLVPAHVDPLSGQPESKNAAVQIEPWAAAWYGFALMREKRQRVPAGYWALARTSSAGASSLEAGVPAIGTLSRAR